MVIQNNTVVISPSSSSSSSPSSSPASSTSSPSSTDSDWLEVKMETDDSPEPDHCPEQSPPELLPDGSRSNIILTPPSAFADSLLQGLQGHQGTPEQQIHRTPAILKNCGGTYTIPGRLPPSVLQTFGDSPRPVSSVSETIRSVGDSDSPRAVLDSTSYSRAVRAESVADTTTTNMTSLLQRGTPSIMATSSMMSSTFAPCSPFSAPNSTRRTPIIMATDSIMGSSTFAVPSPFPGQQPSADTTRRTPSLLVTDSLMGNSTFGVQSLSGEVQSRSNSATLRTPSILVTNYVMGNSTMRTPMSPLRTALGTPQTDIVSDKNSVTFKPDAHVIPSSLSQKSPVCVQSAVTPQTNAFQTLTNAEREMERSEQMMDITPSPDASTLDSLAECWARMDSYKDHEHELKEELQKIKGQFFDLLNTLGLSHDIYYNAVTPAQTPTSVRLDSQIFGRSILSVAGTPGPYQSQGNSRNIDLDSNSRSCKRERMSTPQGTPRRRVQGRQQHGADRSSKYADLVIEQLLAKARTDSSSSKSNSPPDPPNASDQNVNAYSQARDPVHQRLGYDQNVVRLCNNVNVNRGSGDMDTKNSAKSKIIPVYSDFEITDDSDTILRHPESAVSVNLSLLVEPSVSPEALLSTSSGSAPASSNGSSSNSSVPDLSKELVSRVQYYSDFTIDRQKKIDEAMRNLETVAETSNESSPPPSPAEECSSEKISPRCVEGSESLDHFKLPLPVVRPPVTSDLSKAVKSKGNRGKNNLYSSESNESDTSSGTGSLHPSQRLSQPSSHSSHSSRDRRSAHSSSGDRRSSSRGSKCSTHPLASSTLLADPSNSGSPGSGSAYTWSIDNSSEENLHQSFLRSEKRRHRRSRPRRRSKSSHAGRNTSHGVERPATVIGADSPPHEKLPSAGNTLHLTGQFSVINSPPRKFGGNRFENTMSSSLTPHFSSLPRTSTRIGGLLLNEEDGLYPKQKATSSPELTTQCSDLNYAHSRIGPSNLSSDLQQELDSEKGAAAFRDRPDLPGKSSSCDSATSYHSQCLTCNPGLLASPENASMALTGSEDPFDEILTNSPNSYDSSGVQPPYNSYMSPADSSNDYTTVSNSSAEQSIVASAPRQPRAFAMKSPGVFKVPFSPPARTSRRRAGAGGHSTHNVGVRATVGTPHYPVNLLKHKETVSKRKLFAGSPGQQTGGYHAPKILDRKALMRKFKKFSNNFKKDKDNAQIHTLANL